MGQTRIGGMDNRIIGFNAAGLSACGIRSHLDVTYGLMVSPGLISRVIDAELECVLFC